MDPKITDHTSAGSGSSSGSYGGSSSVVGRMIGDFEIQRLIGRGGMGTVYEARQRSLDRTVAIKVLAGSVGLTGNAVIRFQREAQAAAKLTHANIVPIYAQGEEDGIYYYAMELIRGRSLNEIIADLRGDGANENLAVTETRLIVAGDSATEESPDGQAADLASTAHDAGDTVRSSRAATESSAARSGSVHSSRGDTHRFKKIASQIAAAADALAYAHEQGVIHRDIKPHNLIYSDDDRLRITDFGLARVLEQPGVTTTGEFVGSPLYMSSEQITGGKVSVDHRTDIYSLGATLYEWLTLQPPYPGDSREQVISKIISSEPITPRTHDPSIPVDLETICLKAMSKSRDDRYASAGEFADDLRRFVSGESIQARRQSLYARARKWVTRNPAIAVAAAVAIAAVGITGLTQIRSRELKQKVATLEEAHKSVEAQGRSMLETLEETLRTQPEVAERGREAISDFLSTLSSLPGVTTDDGAKIRISPLVESSNKPQAQDRALVADIAHQLLEDLRAEVAVQPAPSLETNPKFAAAEMRFRQALAISDPKEALSAVNQAAIDMPGVTHFNTWYLHGLISAELGEFDEAADDAGSLSLLDPESPAGHVLRGLSVFGDGDYREAIQEIERAVGFSREAATLHVALGAVQSRNGNLEDALANFDRALALAPGQSLATKERSRLLQRVKDVIEGLNESIAKNPKDAALYIRRGELQELREDYRSAVRDYQSAEGLQDEPSRYLSTKLLLAQREVLKRGEEAPMVDTQETSESGASDSEASPAPDADKGGSLPANGPADREPTT